MRVPVGAWILWRLTHFVLIWLFGGAPIDATFQDDGGWFRTILHSGYEVTDPAFETFQNTAFFPGLVWSTKPLTLLMSERAASLIAANLWSLGSFLAVYAAVRIQFGHALARRVIVGIMFWPTSFFLWTYYSEGMFVCLTALGLWSDRKGSVLGSAVSTFGVASCRVIGVSFGPVLAVWRWYRIRRVDAVCVALAVSPLVGLTAVVTQFGLQTGKPLAFLDAQRAWGREFSAPWSPLVFAVREYVSKFPDPALELALNFAAVLLVAFGIAVAVRRVGPNANLAWAAVAWIMPLFTTIVSSQARFALAAWPALLSVGRTDSKLGRVVFVALIGLGAVLSAALLHRFAAGLFVA